MNRTVQAALNRTLARRLKALRKSRGMKVAHLAKVAGVSTNTIYSWERGDNAPTTTHLYILKDAYNCTWRDLLGD